VGYTSVGPLLGGIIASLFMGYTSDPFIRYMTKRNGIGFLLTWAVGGVYEPEFRLPAMILGMPLSVVGLIGFGVAIHNGSSIYLVCFAWGVMVCMNRSVRATLTCAFSWLA